MTGSAEAVENSAVEDIERTSARRLVLAALAILSCRLLLALAVIPPWQQPDEHAHVAVAEVWRNRIASAPTADPGREAEILRSMYEHDWWRHYGEAMPDGPLPAKFVLAPAAATIGIEPASKGYPGAYYGAVGAVLSTIPRMSVTADLYAMRALSMVFAIFTALVAWQGVRVALGERSAGVVALLIALHPQFAVVSTSAAPDALVNLAGACLWWQSMLVLHRQNWLVPLAAMWATAILGAVVDRMGVPLLVVAFIVSVIRLVLRTRMGLGTAAWIGAGTLFVAAMLEAIDARWGAFPAAWVGYSLTVVPGAQGMDFFVEFISFLVESWWFALGWVRYTPPSWWGTAVLALTVCAAFGAVRRWAGERDMLVRTVLGLAFAMIATQVAAEVWTYYRIAHAPQGRHLFPFLVPSLMLLWVGVEAATPSRWRPHAAVGLVLTFALLDSTAWILVGLPAYAT